MHNCAERIQQLFCFVYDVETHHVCRRQHTVNCRFGTLQNAFLFRTRSLLAESHSTGFADPGTTKFWAAEWNFVLCCGRKSNASNHIFFFFFFFIHWLEWTPKRVATNTRVKTLRANTGVGSSSRILRYILRKKIRDSNSRSNIGVQRSNRTECSSNV